MISNNLRLSRVSHPRATGWAVALLVVVFLAFGLWAEAAIPAAHSAPIVLDGAAGGGSLVEHISAMLG